MATLAIDRQPRAAEGPPLRRGYGRAVLDGNELIVKGALEAGVSLITGYPGSPVAEVFTICEQHAGYLAELGVEATLANNEAQSAAMVNGARQVPGARAMAVFKSVGAYVALDGLAIANAARPAEGAAGVVVVGDDPTLSSTQVGADSRLTLSGARIPVLEPSTAQEVKDFTRLAFDLSAESGLIVGVVVTTVQADGAGVVDLAPNRAPAVGPRERVALDTRAIRMDHAVSLPPYATSLEADLLERRLPLVTAAAAAGGVDRLEPGRGRAHRFGIAVSGAAYPLLRRALLALGLDGEVPVLRLGLTWPVDPAAVRRLADRVDEVVVMEERAGHLEDQVRRALEGRRQAVWGKAFPGGVRGFPEASGMDPDIALAALSRLVLGAPGAFPEAAARAAREAEERARALTARALSVTPRTPTYCAGCPHRGTSSPMLEIRARLMDPGYMRRVHGSGPVDVIAHGGIGCYSMAVLPPFGEMHDLSAMGLGGATGAGAAPHVTNKHYVLVGDGTFFHGEMSTIANAIKQRQDILYVILDNKNTAMTGHQGTPASETDLMGRPQTPLEIERIVAAMGPDFLARSNPDDREAHMALLERALLMDGTRVVIADKECAITSGRRRRAERAATVADLGYLPEVTRYNIAEETCENCRECTRATGCPGLELARTPLGEKVAISEDVCVDDGYCAAIKACPSFERVTIRRSRPPAERPAADLTPPPPPEVHRPEGPYRVHLAGVGGMGIGVAGRILIEAAAGEWPEVEVFHRKGMAQRGGGVFSHVVMHDGAVPLPAEIAAGEADLIIGLDPIECARALRLASPARTAAVVDTHRRPTTSILTGDAAHPEDLLERANAETRPGGLLATDVSAAAKRALGDRIYANVALLGAAWQRGWIPMPLEAMEGAVRAVTGRRAEANLRAFLLGRVIAATDAEPAPAETADALIAREEGWIRSRRERRAFRDAVARARASGLGESAMRMLAPRLPEIVAWGGAAYADAYLDAVERVRAAAPALVPAAIHNLHRAMAIKDEVFVAHQLTSERKYARDRERFGIDRANGDRISYEHLNRPAFDVLGTHLEWDMTTRDWQLRLVRRARFLRRLLPSWHRRERAFRDWYVGEVVGAVHEGRLTGAAAEEALRLPETVTGFRGVRYPKEDAAYARFARLMEEAS
jgi:indolepyruvate ferredoxin oxidoreductase